MNLDPETYSAELSPVAACGPDLYDTEPAFAALLDSCEEMLPERFGDFDRTQIDFTDLFKQMDGFLKKSRDLRLLAMLAQFSLLNGQLHQFANTVRIIRRLLETQWDHVHPADANTGFMERIGTLETLNSRPTIFLPLEEAPLFRTRRSGPISYRAIEIAAGNKSPRTEEATLSLGAIDAALTSGELEADDTNRVLDDLADLSVDLKAISSLCEDKLSAVNAKASAPNFENLCTLLGEILTTVNKRLGRLEPEEPAIAEPEGDGTGEPLAASSQSGSELNNAAQAKLVLKAIEAYFASREPSHPALFLVREAHGLVGKSYLDALKVLMPSRFEEVSLALGTSGLQLSNDRLQDLNDSGAGDLGETEGFDSPTIASRADAMRNIGIVKAYFIANEPTSPIPLLLDEAQNMSGGSFANLLGLFLRPDSD